MLRNVWRLLQEFQIDFFLLSITKLRQGDVMQRTVSQPLLAHRSVHRHYNGHHKKTTTVTSSRCFQHQQQEQQTSRSQYFGIQKLNVVEN